MCAQQTRAHYIEYSSKEASNVCAASKSTLHCIQIKKHLVYMQQTRAHCIKYSSRSILYVCNKQKHTIYNTTLEKHLVCVQQTRAHRIQYNSKEASRMCAINNSISHTIQLQRSASYMCNKKEHTTYNTLKKHSTCVQLIEARYLKHNCEEASCICKKYSARMQLIKSTLL